jgi:hypothetical protein
MQYSSNAVADAHANGDAQEEWSEKLEAATRFAEAQVLGEDAVLTQEGFSDYLMCDSHQKRRPVLCKVDGLRDPISDAELLKVLLSAVTHPAVVAAAARELRARYLADDLTQKSIGLMAERFAGAL